MKIQFFDTHVHLNDDLYFSEIDEVIKKAKATGVTKFLCIGYEMEANRRALELADHYAEVYAAIGFHPSEADSVHETELTWLKTQLSNPKVVALGEIGLDYYRGKETIAKQKELFSRQIDLANQYHLPLAIHMREATDDTYQLLKEKKDPSLPGVMHCYSGSVESARLFLSLNLKISLAGPVTFKNARIPKAVASEIDLADLLIETDAPYLAPTPYRGKPNQPEYLPLIAAEIASIKGVSVEEVAKTTWENAHSVFQIHTIIY